MASDLWLHFYLISMFRAIKEYCKTLWTALVGNCNKRVISGHLLPDLLEELHHGSRNDALCHRVDLRWSETNMDKPKLFLLWSATSKSHTHKKPTECLHLYTEPWCHSAFFSETLQLQLSGSKVQKIWLFMGFPARTPHSTFTSGLKRWTYPIL